LTSVHQNILKTQKKKKIIWSKENNKKILIFFQWAFKMQKQMGSKYGYNHVWGHKCHQLQVMLGEI
jgi:GTP-dependent phosphoenolpyruvate carboxykinase